MFILENIEEQVKFRNLPLHKKCPYSESYSGPYSARMRENTDQSNSEYGHFSRSGMKCCGRGKSLKYVLFQQCF